MRVRTILTALLLATTSLLGNASAAAADEAPPTVCSLRDPGTGGLFSHKVYCQAVQDGTATTIFVDSWPDRPSTNVLVYGNVFGNGNGGSNENLLSVYQNGASAQVRVQDTDGRYVADVYASSVYTAVWAYNTPLAESICYHSHSPYGPPTYWRVVKVAGQTVVNEQVPTC